MFKGASVSFFGSEMEIGKDNLILARRVPGKMRGFSCWKNGPIIFQQCTQNPNQSLLKECLTMILNMTAELLYYCILISYGFKV